MSLRIVAAQETAPKPVSDAASGTLNLILANRNGFVIASDSRMSSDGMFLCDGHRQSYCDNSQKLFRTTQRSALVIAGFAVDRSKQSPLDLALTSVLLKQFGPAGWTSAEHVREIPDLLKAKLSQALTEVASLYFPFDPQHFAAQTLSVTFARLDENSMPVLRQLIFSETLTMSGPLQVNIPQFQVKDSGEVPVREFQMYPIGLPYVAAAISDAQWTSEDSDILKYYDRKKHDQLDSMPLAEMRKLAFAILRESKKALLRIGGKTKLVFSQAMVPLSSFIYRRTCQQMPSRFLAISLDSFGEAET